MEKFWKHGNKNSFHWSATVLVSVALIKTIIINNSVYRGEGGPNDSEIQVCYIKENKIAVGNFFQPI